METIGSTKEAQKQADFEKLLWEYISKLVKRKKIRAEQNSIFHDRKWNDFTNKVKIAEKRILKKINQK
jgi:hypothetical protein